MPETRDPIQARFDALAADVSTLTGPGDAEQPVRAARRRRRTAMAAAAVAVAAAVGAGSLAVTGVMGVGADEFQPVTPGDDPLTAANLVRWLPEGKTDQILVADIAGFTGSPGIDADDDTEVAAGDYINSAFHKLQVAPFGDLLWRRLETYVGTGSTNIYVVGLPAASARERVERAGWRSSDDGVYRPGPDTGIQQGVAAKNVRVDDAGDGRTVVVVSDDADVVPHVLSGDPPAPTQEAQDLAALGGTLGYSLPVLEDTPCELKTVSVTSPTTARALFTPPPGLDPAEVSPDDLTKPYGVSAVNEVAPYGDQVMAELEIDDPGVPMEIYRRLGLPGTSIC